jgi:hypothetical protein
MKAPIARQELLGLGRGRKAGLVSSLPLALTLTFRFLS